MAQIRKLDMCKLKDRELIEKLPCAFCGAYKINFIGSEGYESHFSDSDFDCLNCRCSYPVGLFVPNITLEQCKEMMRKRASGYYNQLMENYQEKLEIVTRLKKRLEMYEAHFNPSKREELGK
jgi:hypothetical protein